MELLNCYSNNGIGPAFLFYVINTLSNENDVLTYHDSMRQLRENREQLLHRWAGTWVGSNFERVSLLSVYRPS